MKPKTKAVVVSSTTFVTLGSFGVYLLYRVPDFPVWLTFVVLAAITTLVVNHRVVKWFDKPA